MPECDNLDGQLGIDTGISNSKSFLEIAGIAEAEVAWSNIYAHFMDARSEPFYAPAFINALLELCNIEYSDVFPDGNYCVRTEVATTTKLDKTAGVGKIHIPRIDILIEGKKSIIVENKINHVLNNPLDKYWDYAIRPAVLVVLTISRVSTHELDAYCIKNYGSKDRIKCINVTHYDLITKAKALYGKDFDNPILKELESLIMKKSTIMIDSLYIKDNAERIAANKIYEQESERRAMIVRECMRITAFDAYGTSLIAFKSCPNNNWIHFRYRQQDDLVIGVMTAYMWDWERYKEDCLLSSKNDGVNQQSHPVIRLFVQVHGELYRDMKRKDVLFIRDNGYDISGRYCHVINYDIDMTDAPEKFCRKGELAAFLTDILQKDEKCKILDVAEEIYNDFIKA